MQISQQHRCTHMLPTNTFVIFIKSSTRGSEYLKDLYYEKARAFGPRFLLLSFLLLRNSAFATQQ